MKVNVLLQAMVKHAASDLYLTVGAPPSLRVDGVLHPLGEVELSAEGVKELAYQLLDEEQIAEFERESEMNLSYSVNTVGRFRVNVFRQRGQPALVARHVKTVIPQPDELGLPDTLLELVMLKRGLVIVTGATGSGKSTTLASLIDHRNANAPGHIITVEDPVEFVHRHKRSLVNQREVGLDTDSYARALKNTLRQAPDVILIGEVRDRETMEHAIAFAETGHLCLTTLHSNNANQALDRIVNFFTEDRRPQLLLDLSLNLRAIASQRLIPAVGGGRVAAFEVLLNSPLAAELIKRGAFDELKELMERSTERGMRTFDGDLFRLFQAGRVTREEALKNADSANNLRLTIDLSGHKGAPRGRRLRLEEHEGTAARVFSR
jgi:twitching motility protein PilU